MGIFKISLILLFISLVWAGKGNAETDIYFQNQTGSSITLRTYLSGAPISKDAYHVLRQMILPGQTLKVMSMNRDSGIKNGKTYQFTTTINVGEGEGAQSINMRYYQILKGQFIGSQIRHGVIMDGRNQEWAKGQQGTYLGKVMGNTVTRLRVHETGRGIHADLYYTLETFRAPEARDTFKAVAYNVFMRPISLFKNGQYERAQLLPIALAGRDLLTFEEAFDDDVRGVLKTGLATEYPFQTTVVGTDRGFEQDGGVFIATRFPILEEDEYLFGSVCARMFEDCLADKGVKYAKLWDGKHIIHIFATHLQNGDDSKATAVKMKQVQLIHEFMQRKITDSKQELVLLMGDYNLDIKRNPDTFSRFGLVTQYPMERPLSWDPAYNEMAGEGGGNPEQIDYVFYSDKNLIPTSFEHKVIPLKSKRRWKFLDSMKIFRDLSDHFPVEATITF